MTFILRPTQIHIQEWADDFDKQPMAIAADEAPMEAQPRLDDITMAPPPGEESRMTTGVINLPRIRSMIRHATPHVLEGTVLPVVVFYIALFLSGIWGAIVAALVWSYLGLARRAVSGKRVSGLLLITALTLTVRFMISAFSGSVVVYFLQPAIAKVALAATFMISLRTGEPMLQRLAGDVMPMDESLTSRPCIRRYFTQITILWSLLLVGHALLGVWLVFTVSVETYVLVKTILNVAVKGGAILLSIVMFRRLLRRRGFAITYT